MRFFEDFKVKDGLSVHLWPTKKFRTVYLQIYLHSVLNDETATFMNLLPAVLTRGTKEYPETRQLNTRLDMLYGAGLHSSFTRRGERGLTSISANMADVRCEGRAPLDHLCSLVSSVMFDPVLTKIGTLRPDFLSQEKAGILNDIASVKDDKDAWAEYRCMANMGKDEPFSVHPYGNEDLLKSIGPEPLTSWWSGVLPDLPADIFAVGDFEVLEALEQITASFGGRITGRMDPGPAATYKQAPQPPLEVVENADTVQTKLVMGWRSRTNWASADYPAHVLANHIFGQYSQSKLFMNVREKEGLAYSVGSKIEPTKGLVFAFAGVDPEKSSKAVDVVMQQHRALAGGDITEKELADAKKSMEMGIRITADSPASLYSREMTGIVNGRRPSIEEAIGAVSSCKAEEVAKAAAGWELDTVFRLEPSQQAKGRVG